MTGKSRIVAILAAALAFGLSGAASAMQAEGSALYGDDFESGGFDGNTGTETFSGSWRELGESDGPGAGQVAIYRGGSCASGRCLGIAGEPASRGAWRLANLSATTRATLRFDLSQKGRPADGLLVIAASADGGGTWSTLSTIGRHSHTGTFVVDLTDFRSRETAIAFRLTAGATHEVRIDNVIIDESPPGTDPADDGPPPDHADPKGKPHTTTTTSAAPSTTTTAPPTTTTTTLPPPPPPTGGGGPVPGSDDPVAADTVIGIAIQQGRDLAPPAWTTADKAALRAHLGATDLSSAPIGARELRGEWEPLSGEFVMFTRPGSSVRSRFIPTAIFGALLAWATITGFERRNRRGGSTAATAIR